MTNDERSAAYDKALRDYAEASAHACGRIEAFTTLLVAERVLSAHLAFDPALTSYKERWVP